MADMLEERLRNNSTAFDGLLSLIPGKYYYPKDNSTQWSKRKQSREESQRAKKAKLDPDAATSAADVRERRLQAQVEGREEYGGQEGEAEDENASDGSDASDLSHVMDVDMGIEDDNDNDGHNNDNDWEDVDDQDATPGKAGPKPYKKEKKKQREKKKEVSNWKQGKEEPTDRKQGGTREQAQDSKRERKEKKKKEAVGKGKGRKGMDDLISHPSLKGKVVGDEDAAHGASDIEMVEFPSDGNSHNKPRASEASTNPATLIAPSDSSSNRQKFTGAELRARLAAKIEALRAQRKADNPDGTPARTRQELMEARRRKELQRKERKKQLRLKEKEEKEEKEKKIAAQKATVNGTSTPSGSIIASVSSRGNSEDRTKPLTLNNFAFGRVMFDDGTQFDPTLQNFKAQKKRKGPMDAFGALKHVQAKKTRFEAMEQEKKEAVEKNEKWSKAIKQVNGESIKDDEKLLKKTLKRQEKKKKRSEAEWKERNEAVERAKAAKQKKREENIAARREQKKMGKAGKKDAVKTKKVKKGRPGFEGGLKSRTGGSADRKKR